jgi:hypothetical protein
MLSKNNAIDTRVAFRPAFHNGTTTSTWIFEQFTYIMFILYDTRLHYGTQWSHPEFFSVYPYLRLCMLKWDLSIKCNIQILFVWYEFFRLR